jgi:hypothetical protein
MAMLVCQGIQERKKRVIRSDNGKLLATSPIHVAAHRISLNLKRDLHSIRDGL